jgi:hypothetical protein
MPEKIKLCIYNAQSLINKFITVMQYIQDNKIDIFCINETFLNNNITNINLLNNYTMIRQDRDKRGGGVAIIINKRVQYCNNIGNRVKRETKRCIYLKWNSQCEFLAKSKPSEQVYWRVIKNVESGNEINKQSILPNIQSNLEKASIFANYYEKIFNNSSFDRNFDSIFNNQSVFEPISVEEIVLAINISKSTNSTGIFLLRYLKICLHVQSNI